MRPENCFSFHSDPQRKLNKKHQQNPNNQVAANIHQFRKILQAESKLEIMYRMNVNEHTRIWSISL